MRDRDEASIPANAREAISRRTLLKGGLAAAAGLTLPADSPLLAATPEVEGSLRTSAALAPEAVMATLAAYMKDAQTRALPADAAEHTRLHVLATFAAMVSGSELPPGHAALNFARACGSSGDATVVQSLRRSLRDKSAQSPAQSLVARLGIRRLEQRQTSLGMCHNKRRDGGRCCRTPGGSALWRRSVATRETAITRRCGRQATHSFISTVTDPLSAVLGPIDRRPT